MLFKPGQRVWCLYYSGEWSVSLSSGPATVVRNHKAKDAGGPLVTVAFDHGEKRMLYASSVFASPEEASSAWHRWKDRNP